jgi:chitinase
MKHIITERIVCYYGSWSSNRTGDGKFEVEYIDPYLCTHGIYASVGLGGNGGVEILDIWNEIEKGKYRTM